MENITKFVLSIDHSMESGTHICSNPRRMSIDTPKFEIGIQSRHRLEADSRYTQGRLKVKLADSLLPLISLYIVKIELMIICVRTLPDMWIWPNCTKKRVCTCGSGQICFYCNSFVKYQIFRIDTPFNVLRATVDSSAWTDTR